LLLLLLQLLLLQLTAAFTLLLLLLPLPASAPLGYPTLQQLSFVEDLPIYSAQAPAKKNICYAESTTSDQKLIKAWLLHCQPIGFSCNNDATNNSLQATPCNCTSPANCPPCADDTYVDRVVLTRLLLTPCVIMMDLTTNAMPASFTLQTAATQHKHSSLFSHGQRSWRAGPEPQQ
jgi:hypothetical protein